MKMSEIVGRIYSDLHSKWPHICGWIQHSGAEFIDLPPGEPLALPIRDTCRGAHFCRDQDMLDRWDWGVITSEHFQGEGPIAFDTCTVEGRSGNYICLSLPEDPAVDGFSLLLHSMFSAIVRDWRPDEDGEQDAGDQAPAAVD